MKQSRWVFALAVLMLGVACSKKTDDREAEVMHWWVSGGESAAIRVIADAYTARGGVWKDNAIAGGEVAIPAIISRITGGNPPAAAEMPLGKQIDDYVRQGLLAPIDAAAKQSGFLENVPGFIRKAAVYPDGHMYVLPIHNHGQNWVYYNKKVLADAGVKEPVTWDDYFAALDALKAQGKVLPLAVGAQPWQLGQTFFSVLVTKQGRTLFMKVLSDLDEDAVKSDAFKDAFSTFIKLRNYSDTGAANREWNVAANMVITGKAAFHMMGDWEKGEFTAAGLTPGKEVGCQILGNGDGLQNFIAAPDAFIFPATKSPQRFAVQLKLAETMMDKEVQIAFTAKKGSVPVRLDVDPSRLDACSQLGVNILKKDEQRIPGPDFLISPAFIGAERDLAAQAWADPSMDANGFVAAFLKLMQAEKASRQAAQ